MSGVDRKVRLAAAAAAAIGVAVGANAAAAEETRLTLSYEISISNIRVGEVDAEARLIDDGYALAIRGYTSGISRLVSDASALLASNGFIRGGVLQPYSFEMETTENGLTAQARMAMRGRAITELSVYPGQVPAVDRVPITVSHTRDVIDPLSAFVVPVSSNDAEGEVCDRTLRVFDGWQRFDIALSYSATRSVFGDRDAYSGPAVVCAARYIPVAGHRESQESVIYMAANQRLEAWLVPVPDEDIMLPYQLVIGTAIGELVIRMTHLEVVPVEDLAVADQPG